MPFSSSNPNPESRGLSDSAVGGIFFDPLCADDNVRLHGEFLSSFGPMLFKKWEETRHVESATGLGGLFCASAIFSLDLARERKLATADQAFAWISNVAIQPLFHEIQSSPSGLVSLASALASRQPSPMTDFPAADAARIDLSFWSWISTATDFDFLAPARSGEMPLVALLIGSRQDLEAAASWVRTMPDSCVNPLWSDLVDFLKISPYAKYKPNAAVFVAEIQKAILSAETAKTVAPHDGESGSPERADSPNPSSKPKKTRKRL